MTGKFVPNQKPVIFETFAMIPENRVDRTIGNIRYDDFIAIFGHETLEKIQNKRVFMVGCGAVGCEMLKTFALLGMGTGENGEIFITDDDHVEKSNLNR